MGYRTEQVSASPAFALSAIKTNGLDIYLGGWMPVEKDLIDPLVEAKQAVVLTTNISNALMGLAVPAYVWDAGVHTEADLDKFADKFNHKIYGIEHGSGFNDVIEESIDTNRSNLKDWELVPSSTSAMLAQVKQAIDRKDWIVFLGWEPHSMNVIWDIKYLKAVGEPKIAETRSDVLTVANPRLVENEPEATKFFSQYEVPKNVVSAWILDYKDKDIPAEEISEKWIAANIELVAKWLDGVQTLDGKPAIEAVKAQYIK